MKLKLLASVAAAGLFAAGAAAAQTPGWYGAVDAGYQFMDDINLESSTTGVNWNWEVNDGWTACTGDGVGIKVAVQRTPTVEDLSGSAFLVSSEGTTWLIATAPPVGSRQGSAYRFPMPEDETQSSTLGDRLGFGASATEVDPDWLNLFRLGEPLE